MPETRPVHDVGANNLMQHYEGRTAFEFKCWKFRPCEPEGDFQPHVHLLKVGPSLMMGAPPHPPNIRALRKIEIRDPQYALPELPRF